MPSRGATIFDVLYNNPPCLPVDRPHPPRPALIHPSINPPIHPVSLPRLCYVGPPVAPTFGGPALLFRLLQTYPADRLVFLHAEPLPVAARPSLSALVHSRSAISVHFPAEILANPDPPKPPPPPPAHRNGEAPNGRPHPRLRTLHELTFLCARHLWAAHLLRRLRSRAPGFQPEAILCLIHGWLCEPALLLARRLRIPFHAILHDHPAVALPAPRFLASYRARRWARLCRLAASRLCVSPYMAHAVQAAVADSHANPHVPIPCHLLYPGLAPAGMHPAPNTGPAGTSCSFVSISGCPQEPGDTETGPQRTPPPPSQTPAHAPLTVSFAGTIHRGYVQLLLALARALRALGPGHRLLVHSPNPEALLPHSDASGLPIVDAGVIPTTMLPQTLQRQADVLFLPMSFDAYDAPNMRVSFPSKLAEYCAAARPILICGPPDCSAVRWARQQEHSGAGTGTGAGGGFAEIVDTLSPAALASAMDRLARDPLARRRMGLRALQLARAYFSHEKTFAILAGALGGAMPGAEGKLNIRGGRTEQCPSSVGAIYL